MPYKLYLSKLSLPTKLWACFIVISASFMRQAFNLVITVVSREQLSFIIYTGLALLGLLALYSIVVQKSWIRVVVTLIPLSLMFLLSVQMPLAEERIHILKYGLLGFLVCNDFLKGNFTKNDFVNNQGSNSKALTSAFIFGLIVAVLDEGFQALLPYRVGDIRDIGFDCASIVAGIMVCAICKFKQRS